MAESDLQEIDVEKVPRPKKVPGKDLRPTKRSKKVLSEEFEIEEDETIVYQTDVTRKKKTPYKRKKRNKKIKKDSSNINYNSEEYHKKQHTL
jgi:hypothetical protein